MKIPILTELFLGPPADISRLIAAIKANPFDNTLARFVPEAAWEKISKYVYSQDLERGHILTAKGALDRTLFFVERGSLRVHYGAKDGSHVIARSGLDPSLGKVRFSLRLSEMRRYKRRGHVLFGL
jgi:hypothetical protein